ncbi:MAG TPA: 6-carboxytetrahydropterin synthase [Methanomassiliicoccales archaeon]|jgi:6-pyruvoyltetrahydropterin/6-carboxytetrahydropterin synthase|nr:6-carboxytetrahydropterin synthase [Methanomassiliicoccales archaeon]
MSYSVSVSRRFRAAHWMPSGKAEETAPHQHDYKIEAKVEGGSLRDTGFLLDIDVLGNALEEFVARFPKTSVNELPELHRLPPSMENFAAAAWRAVVGRLSVDGLDSMTITLWEGEDAHASYTQRLGVEGIFKSEMK